MAHPSKAPASPESAAFAPPSAGFFLVPRQLRQDCRQVGINTLKLVLYIADATLGWDCSRWAALTYSGIVAEAGIPNDTGVRRAIEEAQTTSLIEVQTTAAGTLYAIHRRYWVLARIQPKWHLYKRVPYAPQIDPLDESPSAITMMAEQSELSDAQRQAAITTIAQPLETDAPPHGSAITRIASDYHQDSKLPAPGKQPTITMIAQPLSAGAPDLASRDAKEISKENRNELRKEGAERISETTFAQDLDALAQHLADQQVLQSLLAERQSLLALQPGQSGWGAAQRRLRAIAPEIARLQALAVPSATGAEGSAASAAQDLDALQQRQIAERAIQKLLAEQEQLQALLPSQRGWGAAQGRLRSIAREIDHYQALATPPATADSPAEPEAAGEADPSEARRFPPQRTLQRSNDPPEPAQDTRWQRLMKLQGELAQLKRTPSMQLLARQRIPRLEEAIKHLIASLAESA